MTIKVRLRLQSLLIDYKGLQSLNFHYKVRVRVKRSSKVSLTHPSHSRHIFDGEMAGVCTDILQRPYSIFSLRNYIQRRAGEAKKYPRCAFWRFLFTNVCLGHPLEKFVVSAFLDYKSSKCPLFETIKVCRVCAFLLQKFVVSAFSLLKFKVSAFLDYKGL